MVPIAHGNDHGGSIRYPAYACGVVGLRPTVGRVPHSQGPPDADELPSVQSMAVDGPLARSVADLRIALDAMSGFGPRDPVIVPMPPTNANEPLPRPVRVGLVRDAGITAPQPAVDEALDTAAEWLGDADYVVEEVELPSLGEACRLWYLLCMEEFRQIMPLVEEIGDEGMKRAAATYYAAAKDWWGEKPDLGAYISGYARRGTLIRRLQAFMQDYPLVLLPVSAEQAFEYDADIASIERGRRVVAVQWPMTAVPTLGFPAVSVPTGVAGGLPVGVQLLGRRFREDTIFDAAEVIEARGGVLTPIDPR
jgi:amidase